MSTIKVNPGDTYQAHLGGNGTAGIVAATVTVHRPTGRVVEEWAAEDFAILGARVSDIVNDGYTVTPYAEDGR
ncbi:MAG: hypothetical protein KBB14_20800 [Thermoanaerobaculia bacterium]|nr:hypothetical protein [Thermoanaerobaculia bacterium]